MKTTMIGLDLAKNVFQVHGVNERGKAVLCKQLKRDQVTTFFANLPPCLVGIEACASSHHWARKLQALYECCCDHISLVAFKSQLHMQVAT